MNYNHFTINYIEAIKFHLKIEIVNGQINFFPDFILPKDIENLKNALENIWESSESSISIIKTKQESKVQSGLFGLVNNFDLALKTGYLLSDRVVVIDYIFERLLKNKNPEYINIERLGSIGANLVSALELAKKGRFVIIPSPFYWYPKSKQIITEVSEKVLMSPNLMSMLNMLSITKVCQLHPYTIAESIDNYDLILNQHIDFVNVIGYNYGKYAYEGILGALLSEKLLNEIELSAALNVPIDHYFEIINAQENFYSEYLSSIIKGGDLNGEMNIDKIKSDIKKTIKKRNIEMPISIIKNLADFGGIGSGMISVLAIISVISTPLVIMGGLLGLSATLGNILNRKENGETQMINVFTNLSTSNNK